MKNNAQGPVRMCVICRRRFLKSELTRFRLMPDGVLQKDEKQIGPGRGWYICSDPHCAKKFLSFRVRATVRRG
ncbi:MAG: DUF448 domain-containing protein [Desulfovibrio sp.]|nr:DUF448 domain-containing protein [Desulfovibrio sp.]